MQASSRPMPRSRGPAGHLRQAGAAAVGAHVLLQEFLHPLHALLVLHLGQGVFHGIDRVEIGEVQLCGLVQLFAPVEDVLFLRRPVVDDVLLLPASAPGRARPSRTPMAPAHVGHQRPHEAVPGGPPPPSSMVRDSSGTRVERSTARTTPVPPQVRQGPLAVEGQLLSAGGIEMGAALRAGQLLPRRHRQGGRHIVPVGAAVAGQAGVHQPQAVEQLRPRAEGAADSRHAGPLVEGQGRRDIQHLVHVRPGRLGHPAAGVGGQGPLNTAGSPRHTGRPAPERIFRSRTPRRCRRFGSAELLRQYFSNCGLWHPGPGSCPAYAPATSFYPSFLPPFQGNNGLSSHPVKS